MNRITRRGEFRRVSDNLSDIFKRHLLFLLPKQWQDICRLRTTSDNRPRPGEAPLRTNGERLEARRQVGK
jgi:hypothetical protein